MWAAAGGRGVAFPPHECELALATLLLKVLDPRFVVRDRPDRTSPRATTKAGDVPAGKGPAQRGQRHPPNPSSTASNAHDPAKSEAVDP